MPPYFSPPPPLHLPVPAITWSGKQWANEMQSILGTALPSIVLRTAATRMPCISLAISFPEKYWVVLKLLQMEPCCYPPIHPQSCKNDGMGGTATKAPSSKHLSSTVPALGLLADPEQEQFWPQQRKQTEKPNPFQSCFHPFQIFVSEIEKGGLRILQVPIHCSLQDPVTATIIQVCFGIAIGPKTRLLIVVSQKCTLKQFY